jgi:hypothetical protein
MAMKYLPKQTHRAGEVIETFEKKGKPYQKVIKICSRCNGDGNYSYNELDGTICYGCHGSGIQVIEERILTDKEKEQKERARIKRLEKKESDRQQKIIQDKIDRENKVNDYIKNNPITYVVTDKNSYNIKEMLKANKYKWLTWYWVGHKKIEGVEVIEIETAKVINEYGYLMDTIIKEIVKG